MESSSSPSNPNRTSSSSSWSLLRVLCLHDARSNSLELSTKLDSLGEKLYRNHGIDLVFVDAPLILNPDESGETVDEGECDDEREVPRRMNRNEYHPPRAWWEEENGSSTRALGIDGDEEEIKGEDDDESEHGNEAQRTSDPEVKKITSGNQPLSTSDSSYPPSDSRNHHYLGLDASLLLLRQVWNSSPFWGIMAVGQAAGVAALLPLLPTQSGKEAQPPSFMIFVNGRTLLDEEELLTEHLALPCLHIIDPTQMDEGKPIDSSRSNSTERLVRQFGGNIVCDDNGSWSTSSSSSPPSHSIKLSSRTFNNHVGRFLVAQKHHLRKTTGDAVVLALRHELHRTEADAAQLVAKQIAENPPDALMAVITPRDVGGFRDKRRGPGEEGGGAPCPSEFLLHKAKRGGKTKNENGDDSFGTGSNTAPQDFSKGKDASRHYPNQQRRSNDYGNQQ